LGGTSGLHVGKEPLASFEPGTLQGAELHVEHVGSLFVGEAEEVLEFDDGTPVGVFGGELGEEVVDGEGGVEVGRGGGEEVVEAFEWDGGGAWACAGVIDEVAAHSSTGNSEKVGSIPPIAVAGVDEAEVDLVDEFGGL